MMIRRAVARSDRVLTVSEATRADLVDLVDADPSKIEVIRHGCDPYFLEAVDDLELSNVAEKYSLDRPFLLSVTNIKPHKNLKRLLESFGQLRRDYDDLDLVIAGGDFSQHPELQAACKSYGIEDRVKPLGFRPKKELRALYSLARIFVFPSLYEGSGLPPLEAWAVTGYSSTRTASTPLQMQSEACWKTLAYGTRLVLKASSGRKSLTGTRAPAVFSMYTER
jgi:glycosyltransferase involved in cell wall biosynthesis